MKKNRQDLQLKELRIGQSYNVRLESMDGAHSFEFVEVLQAVLPPEPATYLYDLVFGKEIWISMRHVIRYYYTIFMDGRKLVIPGRDVVFG